MHVDDEDGRDAFLAGLRALMAVADELDDEKLLAAAQVRFVRLLGAACRRPAGLVAPTRADHLPASE
jgi:hypothetical protein